MAFNSDRARQRRRSNARLLRFGFPVGLFAGACSFSMLRMGCATPAPRLAENKTTDASAETAPGDEVLVLLPAGPAPPEGYPPVSPSYEGERPPTSWLCDPSMAPWMMPSVSVDGRFVVAPDTRWAVEACPRTGVLLVREVVRDRQAAGYPFHHLEVNDAIRSWRPPASGVVEVDSVVRPASAEQIREVQRDAAKATRWLSKRSWRPMAGCEAEPPVFHPAIDLVCDQGDPIHVEIAKLRLRVSRGGKKVLDRAVPSWFVSAAVQKEKGGDIWPMFTGARYDEASRTLVLWVNQDGGCPMGDIEAETYHVVRLPRR